MDENTDQYRWQSGYEKTWEAIKETDDGFLDVAFAQALENAKKKQMQKRTETMKLGMMRHVFLVLDFSEAMSSQDLKPTRLICMLKILECFLTEFFDQNPISQLGMVIMRNKRAEKLLDLSGSMQKHRKLISTLMDVNLVGEPSIQNALDICYKSLKLLPTHTSKEVILIVGSLTTCDPSDINETIKGLKTESIQCSIIGLAAEVNVCHRICKETGGSYNVILDDSHFLNLLMSFVEPPSAVSSMKSSLVKMGFPHNMDLDSKQDNLGICMCHLDNKDECRISTGGHYCPQCFSKYCELPVECKSCGLTLVSAPHLARSYHHLFPIKNYTELFFVDCKWNKCYSCQKKLSEYKYVYECSLCKQVFCKDCNEFIHEILHVCPGCSTTRSADNC